MMTPFHRPVIETYLLVFVIVLMISFVEQETNNREQNKMKQAQND